ncbi:MAG: ribosome silencing factor [Alphaproteobacteria bacterium]
MAAPRARAPGNPKLKKDPILELILRTLDDGQAEDVVTIALAGKSAIADYMVIASGRSQRHMATLADKLAHVLKTPARPRVPIEGAAVGDWVLVDGGDAIVHIFKPETRRVYNLEKMWGIDLPETEFPERAALLGA